MSIETTPSSTPDPEWERIVGDYLNAPGEAPVEKPATSVDLMGDTPLTPAWTKTRTGWKSRAAVGRVNTVRGFRKWLRRQATEHGLASQVGRGVRRTALWVQGTEGVQILVARHELQQTQRDYKAAKWAHDRRLLPGKEKDKRRRAMEDAFDDSASAMSKYKGAQRDARMRRAVRGVVALAPIAGVEGAGLQLLGAPGGLAATAATLATFALIGRRTAAGELYTDRDTKIGDGVKPDAQVLDKAMREAGILKGDHTVELLLPPALDGKAWVMPVALSGGPTVGTVRARITELAAAFGVPTYQVDVIDSDDGRGDQFTLWVSRVDPFRKVFVSPLVNKPVQVDAFGRGVLIGYNRRGEPIYLKMGHVMAILGGASRTGKGMLLRNLICGLGLDPTVNLRLVAGAKPGEHAGYAPICATFFGRDPYRLIILLEELLEEGKRREDILNDRKKAKASQGDLKEFPLEVLIIDEYKQYVASTVLVPDPSAPYDPDRGPKMVKAADRIAHLLEELAAFVAALNITILLSTQDPDANTIPRGFKSNSVARVATRTMSPVQTNAILKDGATGAGMLAHEIPKSLKGSAIVDIDGYEGEIIRSCFIEDEKYDGAEGIVAAGAALRSQEGRAPGQFDDRIEEALAERTGLTSVAGGAGGFGRPSRIENHAERADASALDLILAAFGDATRISLADVRAHLADYDPEKWGPLENEEPSKYEARFGKLIKAEIAEALEGTDAELEARQIRMADGQKPRGYRLEDVEDAIKAARSVR
ncbi:hypothetical protein ACIP25_11575 [Streptomyces massasporeus]|uniref:hypothetical protein n=1 Tax=Streptomyces massasporeus TaxID=67324 RepID=UPI0038010590